MYFETSAMSASHGTFNLAHLTPRFDRFGNHNSIAKYQEMMCKRPAYWQDTDTAGGDTKKRDLWFSQLYCWRISYSGTWRRVYWQIITDVSKGHNIQGQAAQEEFANPIQRFFYESTRITIVYTTAGVWSLSCARVIHFTPQFIYLLQPSN